MSIRKAEEMFTIDVDVIMNALLTSMPRHTISQPCFVMADLISLINTRCRCAYRKKF